MLISDGGTSLKFPEFLNIKSSQTVTSTFAVWQTEAENQTGRKIQCVRIDLGGEFDSGVFLGHCKTFGIRVEKVPKASSSANGHVERGNRTIIEGVRTQLVDSGLDTRFWAEAATAHAYVRGFIPSARHPDIVPWSKWYKNSTERKLNVSHIRPWGSRCWVKDLDRKEGKLGVQSWEGRMVGYMGRRGYRVYDIQRRRIFQVRDVVFEEGAPHRTRINVDEGPYPDPGLYQVGEDADNIGDQPPPAPVPLPPAQAAPPARNPDPPVPVPPIRRSARVPKPTEAILRMQMSEQAEEQAWVDGEDWANDWDHPTANYIDLSTHEPPLDDDFDTAHALASILKGGRDA